MSTYRSENASASTPEPIRLCLASLCKIRLNDVSEMFNCWGRHWFINEDASFFHFFHKITNIRSCRCFSSSKIPTQFSHTFYNITMIFKVMPQYFSVLFKRIHNHIRSADILLIICQNIHKLSVKKRWDGRPNTY